ncbi:MAG TPA: geopeptide radical SAM maturase [Nitrospirota bacterium]|nr:geopeptide radical SAM maturase [Nitrospirota bacterium]
MKLSCYSKLFTSQESADSVIAYSTQNAAAALIPSELIPDINKGNLSPEEQEILTDLGILVSSREEEKIKMQNFINELNDLNRSVKFIIVLNMDCNLSCKYCFEGKRKGRFYLSEETADKFINFISRSDLTGKESIKIVFYGGEPLLSLERIVSISGRIGAFTHSRGLKYGFTLVTNGTLLTSPVVKRLKEIGLQSAKITLDGPKDIHDLYRPFKSGTGSFDTIIRNIKEACNTTTIHLGGNYTQENFREFPRLLDDLAANGLTPDKIPFLKFDPVVNESNEFAPADFHDGCESSNEPWISDAAVFLREEILRRGYRTQKIVPMSCFAEFKDNIVVNYDGTLYKCPGLIGREQFCVGDLERGQTDYRVSHGLDVWKNKECLECAYLPLCFGGCKYMKAIRDGNMSSVICQKEYYDGTLAKLVSQDIQYDL